MILRPAVWLLAAALVLGQAGCNRKPQPAPKSAEQARSVRVTTIQTLPIAGAIAASGDLVPREEAAVLPEVNGYRVDRVLVDEGAYVRAGQALVTLNAALINSQLAQQTALAAQAAVQAEQAEAQAARVAGLDGEGVLSQEQIEQRRFQARAARAAAQAQAAAARDLRTRAGKLTVTAPVSGLVLERSVRPGDNSAVAAQAPWFRIARDGAIELEAQMAESDLAKVRPGQPARVSLPSGADVAGVVRLVSPSVDVRTKLGAVRVSLPVRGDIRSGGFARAAFGGASAMAPAVPESAIRYDADGASVMVVGTDNRVMRTIVQTGVHAGGLVELVRGPPVGTRIVAASAAFLMDKDLIRPVAAAGDQRR